jgi:hypothetical protein
MRNLKLLIAMFILMSISSCQEKKTKGLIKNPSTEKLQVEITEFSDTKDKIDLTFLNSLKESLSKLEETSEYFEKFNGKITQNENVNEIGETINVSIEKSQMTIENVYNFIKELKKGNYFSKEQLTASENKFISVVKENEEALTLMKILIKDKADKLNDIDNYTKLMELKNKIVKNNSTITQLMTYTENTFHIEIKKLQ